MESKRISRSDENLASKNAKKKHADPNVKFGWQKRTVFEMSYPEKLANYVLESSGIKYEREYSFHPYFIDFALLEHKIAIEIDGQQHTLCERKSIDDKKDKLLKENGWQVYRVKWPEENILQSVKDILARIPSL